MLAAVLLLWVGVSNLMDASSQPNHTTDMGAPAAAAVTPAAADMLPWMRQRADHLALNERWGLSEGPARQPSPEVLGHHIPRILHHSERCPRHQLVAQLHQSLGNPAQNKRLQLTSAQC